MSEPSTRGCVIRKVPLDVEQFPPLPEVAWRVLKVTSDLYRGASEMVGIISHDQALTARILRVANSAYFQRTREIGTVQQALAVLGNRRIRGIVVAAALGGILYRSAVGRRLWQHALAVGTGARELALRLSWVDAEEAFVAGLLHDIGKSLLEYQYPTLFQEAVDLIDSDPEMDSCRAERVVFGLDHLEAGIVLAGSWGLPEVHTQVIGGHHETTSDRSPLLTSVVKVADRLCNHSGLGVTKAAPVRNMDPEAAALLGLPSEELDALREEFLRKVAADASLFGLEVVH